MNDRDAKAVKMEVGKHYFDGSLRPVPGCRSQNDWFSVGLFECVPAKHGVKRGPVLIRVTGNNNKAYLVYKTANHYCLKLDSGEPIRQKTITVGVH